MSSNPPKYTGIIAWFAQNSVAANLLMVFIIVAGLMSYQSINKKMFPDYSPNIIQVSVAHLGAAPEEGEQSVILKVEEAIENTHRPPFAFLGLPFLRVFPLVLAADWKKNLPLAVAWEFRQPYQLPRPLLKWCPPLQTY